MTVVKLKTVGHRTKKEIETRNKKLEFQENNPDQYVLAPYKGRHPLNPLKNLYRIAKCRAKRKGLDFNIELCDLKLPTECPLLEVPMGQHLSLDYHFSLDRIDSTKGYIKGNVMVISHRANRLKNNATSKELFLLAKNLAKFEGIS